MRAVSVESNLHYIAGIFDGEGYAGVSFFKRKSKKGTTYTASCPQITIKMQDREAIDLACYWLGSRPIVTTERKHNKDYTWYNFHVSHRKALNAARILLPFVRLERRRKQLEEIINHYDK